jgi:hypothetical protein
VYKAINGKSSKTFRTYVDAVNYADAREQVFQRIKGCWIPLY